MLDDIEAQDDVRARHACDGLLNRLSDERHLFAPAAGERTAEPFEFIVQAHCANAPDVPEKAVHGDIACGAGGYEQRRKTERIAGTYLEHHFALDVARRIAQKIEFSHDFSGFGLW